MQRLCNPACNTNIIIITTIRHKVRARLRTRVGLLLVYSALTFHIMTAKRLGRKRVLPSSSSKNRHSFKARSTNVVHDLGSAEPRSKVEPSSRWITLHQVELESADPIQLNGRGYTVDDADWSTSLGLRVNYDDVTGTRSAYERVQYILAVICSNFKAVEPACHVLEDGIGWRTMIVGRLTRNRLPRAASTGSRTNWLTDVCRVVVQESIPSEVVRNRRFVRTTYNVVRRFTYFKAIFILEIFFICHYTRIAAAYNVCKFLKNRYTKKVTKFWFFFCMAAYGQKSLFLRPEKTQGYTGILALLLPTMYANFRKIKRRIKVSQHPWCKFLGKWPKNWRGKRYRILSSAFLDIVVFY